MSDFIGVYDDALSTEFCQHCVEKFAHSNNVAQGETGQGVDLTKKNSMDLMLNQQSDWQSELQTIHQAVLDGLVRYTKKWPYVLVGALALQVESPEGPRQISALDIENMNDEQLANIIKTVFRLGGTNLQQYKRQKGGYFYYHSEFYPHPNDPGQDSLHRVLLWMFYLNDVAEGGHTEFYFQQKKIKPKQGTLVIAPAFFTHTHRGNRPESEDKYILTSWLMYRKAQELYGQR
ncbi:2OG-Fe(II) oxygenase [Marinicella gelatinilytica]|uniref:2OG-Fe(II) oxygenase n=1 Tax=Marinicella gelatinilytica TaxID=2996017 RepID=UPI002260B15C|nr:2OG-Fe(II) oxygenase [Marinicella gelatinilytica]MCX7544350.1 2OG-Fe(II) oxygenase [Marinicella gelatinilytica]